MYSIEYSTESNLPAANNDQSYSKKNLRQMICVAAPSFNAPSETFIRNHVQAVALGRTILLCRDGTGADALGCPVLADVDPWCSPRTFGERIINAIRYRWRLYVDPGLHSKERRRVVAFLKAHNATAVLAEYGPMGCLLMNACREAGVPLYVHFHGYDASILARDWRQRRHYRKLFRIADGIIAPSHFLRTKLVEIGCPPDKLHVSPCGIDVSGFRPSSRIPGRVVAVGRLVEKKAPHLTIKAFARIAARFPDSRLEIIGDGPLRERCAEFVASHGLQDRVVLHGFLGSKRVAALMREAAIFVQHSVTADDGDTEGLPVAILEAMASAVPVISTFHSGIPEAVEDGISGVLVAEHDVNGMADAMVALLSDPTRAAAMGAAGRARVLKGFTIAHTRDRLRSIMGLSTPSIESVH